MKVPCLPAALLALLLLAGCGAAPQELPLGDRIENAAQVVEELRAGLRGHASRITVTFDYGGDIYGELNGAVERWVEAALAETEDPAEGDYLRCQLGGYTWDSSFAEADGLWRYSVSIVPDYYDYLVQEEAVTDAVGKLLEGFRFPPETPEAEKIAVIYDAVCQSVDYDKVHRKNPYSHLKSTAYGALVLGSATCQGYCAALYRLLRECGISCRIIKGTAGGEFHAWVIAAAGGRYYNLDPTWDAGAETYGFFLRGSADFPDHVPDEAFLTGDFADIYPMAKESFRKEG